MTTTNRLNQMDVLTSLNGVISVSGLLINICLLPMPKNVSYYPPFSCIRSFCHEFKCLRKNVTTSFAFCNLGPKASSYDYQMNIFSTAPTPS